MDAAELTDAEQLVWNAFPCGAWVDLGGADVGGGGGKPAEIRAEVITALLLGAVDPDPGHAAGIRLRGATVTGRVDLTGGTVMCPLICEDCRFDDDVVMVDAAVRTVVIARGELPRFDGARMRLDGILDLTGTTIAGPLRLGSAKVSGRLRLRDVHAGDGTRAASAVEADGLSVDGDADCTGLVASGTVSLEAAALTGSLNLAWARISAPRGRGLNLNYAAVGGRLAGKGLVVQGETRANNCRVTAQLTLSGASLDNPGGIAFFAGGLEVGGGAFFTDGFRARGEFRLIGARLAANLTLRGADFGNPGGVAVNLERASVGTLEASGVSCQGQLSMTGVSVSGDVNLADAVLGRGDGQLALTAERAQVGGTLWLRDGQVRGGVDLRIMEIGQRLNLIGADLRNPGGIACRLSRAKVGADVFCGRMTAVGQLKMTGAVVGSGINLDATTLACPGGTALDARNVKAQQLSLRPKVIDGEVDLSHAAVGMLRDDPATWPERLYLDGLTYQALDPPLPAGQRLSWLDRDPRGHQPQPYEQLAAHYNAVGWAAQARDVQYARERIQRRGKGAVARAWNVLQDVAVGYGYRPRRALAWLALLLITGSVVFSAAPPPPLKPAEAPHFNGIVYTLDLMLPVVGLGQKDAFNPGGAEQWLSYLLIAAGWILATTVAAGAARVLRR